MVATVGSISIDLSTNARQFADGFRKNAATVETQSARMAKAVSAVERNVAGMAGTLKNFGVGLAAGVGLTAIASLGGAFDKLKQTISEYDEIATNAKTTGLKPETYQALAFSAKQANIEQESFNSSLTIFAKNAGLAQKGTGALYAGLKSLNPQLLQNILNTKDQEERLKLVSDALAQTTDATQKAALSAVVFGKGGVEMARFLDQGRASIEAMKKSARDMGIIVPDELLQRAGELDDKLDVLSKVIHVQLGEALINLAPLLVNATQGFANFSKQVNSTASDVQAFVNDPSWANFNKLLVALGSAPIREDSVLDRLAKGTLVAPGASDVGEITKGIDFLKQKIAELQEQAAHGANVKIEIDEATASLDELKARLGEVGAVGVSAANEIRAGFAEAFRAAENASMDALASMRGTTAGALPNVTRYGGDPNQIDLPGVGAPTVQTNVNGSGVGVTKYSSATASNTEDTAGYTHDTADNVSKLNQNTKGYFRDLGTNIDGGLTTISHTVSSLSDLIGNEFRDLPSYLTAALSANTSSSGGGGMFGPNWDPRYGSYTRVVNIGRPGSIGYDWEYGGSKTSSQSGTQVSVAQPGSDITLNYYAAAGESEQTAKQRARDMYRELVQAQAST